MKKSLFLIIVCLCFINITIGQEKVSIVGIVQDSIKRPLEFSNVLIYKKTSKDIFTYAITDAEGRFKIETFKDSTYTIKASFVGFESYVETFKSTKDDYKLITLKESENSLDEVTVTYDLPVKISGDTISYKVDAFTNGKERKLEDVIEKLPGFEIDDDGNIKVQGKKVEKILVDGKKFFSGDTKLATKNIPADVVSKINILKNFNEVEQMKGLNDDETYAIDIRLKEGKKNIIFGSVEGGLGNQRRYNAHMNSFYFNPKASINFIGDINNIGEQAFTFQDYFKFNGGFKNAGKKSSFGLSSDLLGLTGLQDNKFQNSISKLGALNYTYNPNKKLNFSGFIIHSEIDYDIRSNAQKVYVRDDNNSIENLTSAINQESISDIAKLSTNYIPNNKLQIQYDALLNTTRIEEESHLNSIFDANSNETTSIFDNKSLSFQHQLGAFYAHNENNVYSLQISHSYKNQENPFNLFSDESPFNTIIPFVNAEDYNILQDFEVKTNSLNGNVDYYYVINDNNHINMSLGVDVNNQSLSSRISQNTSSEQVNFTESNLLNNTTFDYVDSYFGFGYRTKFDKLTVDSKLALHFYDTKNKQGARDYKLNKTLLLPNIKFKYNFKKSRILSLSYEMLPEFSDIQKLAQGIIIKDYNVLFRGNPELRNALYQNINLDYYDFNAYNFSNLYAVISYQIKKYDFNNVIDYTENNSISTPINIANPNTVFTGYLSYDRRFRKIKINASANVASLNYKSLLGGVLVDNSSFNQDYELSFETRMDDFPIIELGFRKAINNYKSDAVASQSYVTNRPFANLELSFLKHFVLTADYEYTIYKNKSIDFKSEYDFLNASLFYKKEDSKFEFKLAGLNILNTTELRSDSFSNNFISTSRYFVQPQYFLMGVIYSF